jgi:hypothetical protein
MRENETAPNTQFRVFDIPLELSVQATERILNAECGNDRFISAITPVPGALRVVLSARAGTVKRADDDRAIALVRAHPELSQVRTVAMLKANGIHRTQSWVSQKRFDIEAERNAAQRK